MKRIYLLLMLLAATAFNLAAQDDGYKPFVEEGKRWVFQYEDWRMLESYIVKLTPFSYQIKGDTVFNDTAYKLVWREDDNSGAYIYGFVREQDHKVFFKSATATDEETILYDFKTPQIQTFAEDYTLTPITRQERNGFYYNDGRFDAYLIEGVGLDGECLGDTFNPEILISTGMYSQRLNYVEDGQGNVIYRGLSYTPPLVREGVVWHYNEIAVDGFNENNDPDRYYFDYRIEFRGDTVIGGHTYKCCYRYTTATLDVNATIPVGFMYDENHCVYYMPNEEYAFSTFLDCQLQPYLGEQWQPGDEPVVLYDFNFHIANTSHEYEILSYDEVDIDRVPCKRFVLDYPLEGGAMLVEGIGIDSKNGGDLLCPLPEPITGYLHHSYTGLVEVIRDGEVIYKGMNEPNINALSDLTGDGRVDVADINAAVSAVMGMGDKAKADVNGDGKVDIADINAVLNVMLNR